MADAIRYNAVAVASGTGRQPDRIAYETASLATLREIAEQLAVSWLAADRDEKHFAASQVLSRGIASAKHYTSHDLAEVWFEVQVRWCQAVAYLAGRSEDEWDSPTYQAWAVVCKLCRAIGVDMATRLPEARQEATKRGPKVSGK